ncbi:MAG: phosphatidylglycerophosphatase A family protein [Phycisphaerales bacterium]
MPVTIQVQQMPDRTNAGTPDRRDPRASSSEPKGQLRVQTLLLTVFGLGFMRPAPGTWGSLPPCIIAFAIISLVPTDATWLLTAAMILLALAAGVVCIALGHAAEVRFGSKDPSQVVADEVAGQSLVFLALPWYGPDDLIGNGIICAVALLSFRFFDITKLWPAHQLQRYPAGWGILLDDLAAGVWALAVTQIAAHHIVPVLW